MFLKSIVFSIFFTYIICILDVKSDPSQLPPDQREADFLALFFQDNNFRDRVVAALTTTEVQATQELFLINYYRESIRNRIQDIQRLLNSRPQNQAKPRLLVEALRRHLIVIVERTRGGATVEQLIRYRQTLVQHLQDLYDLQERVTRRNELDTLINHLNEHRQFEQQQRQKETPLNDQVARDQREKEYLAHDLLEREIRTRIQSLQQTIDREQPMNDRFQLLKDILVDLWIALQARASKLQEQREQDKRADDLRIYKLHIADPTTPPSPRDTRRTMISSFRQTGNGLRRL